MMTQIFTAIATVLVLGSTNRPPMPEIAAPQPTLQDHRPIPLTAEMERGQLLDPAIAGLE